MASASSPSDSGGPARRLRAEQRRAAAVVEERRAQLRMVAEHAATEGRDDEHDPDGATSAFEQSLASGLLAQAVAYLDEVDAALDRYAAGTYGRCEECGRLISPERLGAQPAARSCVDCASRRSVSRRGRGSPMIDR